LLLSQKKNQSKFLPRSNKGPQALLLLNAFLSVCITISCLYCDVCNMFFFFVCPSFILFLSFYLSPSLYLYLSHFFFYLSRQFACLFVCVWQVQSSIHQRKPKWCEPRNEGTFNTNLPNLSNKRILTEHQKVDTSAALNKKNHIQPNNFFTAKTQKWWIVFCSWIIKDYYHWKTRNMYS